MDETLAYIDNYFERKLSAPERQIFEQRCARDEGFAGEVAFYITSREAIRQKLLEQKIQEWPEHKEEVRNNKTNTIAPVRKMNISRWLPYAAAACLGLAIAVYFLYPSQTPAGLADQYLKQRLTILSQTMDGATDSLQDGIRFIKEGANDSALAIFKSLSRSRPEDSEVGEYLGLVYLVKKDYEKALLEFDQLSDRKLKSNPGTFLKAVTLLQRKGRGDKEAAKVFLEQVRDQQLEGKAEAIEWLKTW